jgi:hypothetical protein
MAARIGWCEVIKVATADVRFLLVGGLPGDSP